MSSSSTRRSKRTSTHFPPRTPRATLSAAEYAQVVERYLEHGVTDGLPVVPPYPEAVSEMVEASGRPGDDVLGRFRMRSQPVTVHDLAVNAVMAGCLPAYMPLILTAAEVILDPALAVDGLITSSAAIVPWVVVNGPARLHLGVNCGGNLLGPGVRANATIGRAIRLALFNLAGASPHKLGRATLGSAYHYTCVLGEHEEISPWEPVHLEHGYDPADSTVLLAMGLEPRQVSVHRPAWPRAILSAISDELAAAARSEDPDASRRAEAGPPRKLRGALVMLGPDHARHLHMTGSRRETVRETIAEAAGMAPSDVIVLVAGGPGGRSLCTELLRWRIGRIPPDALSKALAAGGPVRAASAMPPAVAIHASVADRYVRRGFTDGLPIVAPAARAVDAMVRASGRAADDELRGTLAYRPGPIRVRDVSVQAVMAGCLPEHMPVVLAAYEVLLEMGIAGWIDSTAGNALWIVVNGPIRRRLGIECGTAAFGPGSRANATIGRAVRLGLINLGQIATGRLDRATFGQAYMYTCVVGEDEESSPWLPLHTTLGLEATDDAVTVLGCGHPRQTAHARSGRPESILQAIVDDMSTIQSFDSPFARAGDLAPGPRVPHARAIVVFGGDHRAALGAAGWSREAIQTYVATHAGRRAADVRRLGYDEDRIPADVPDATFLPTLGGPGDVVVLAAGGPGGHSMSARVLRSATRRIA